MYTDTEVVAYLVDLLIRKHGLSEKMAVRALAPPFWEEIDQDSGKGAGTQPGNSSCVWICPHEWSVCNLCRKRKHDGGLH